MKFTPPNIELQIDYLFDVFDKHRANNWSNCYCRYVEEAESWEEAARRIASCSALYRGKWLRDRNTLRIKKTSLEALQQFLLNNPHPTLEEIKQIHGIGDYTGSQTWIKCKRYWNEPIELETIMTKQSSDGRDWLISLGRNDEFIEKFSRTGPLGLEDGYCQAHQLKKHGYFRLTTLE